MLTLLILAEEIQRFCLTKEWRFCFIGGIALQRWGEPRVTVDLDLSILTGFGEEENYIRPLLDRFPARIPDAHSFALTHRVLLLRSTSNIGIDIALGGIPFEESVIVRSSSHEFLTGVHLLTCSAEDLIVYKAFADRSRDWSDIEGILVRQRNELDWTYILTQLTPLVELKEVPSILSRLAALRSKI